MYSSAPFSACGYECVSKVATCTLVGLGLTIINNGVLGALAQQLFVQTHSTADIIIINIVLIATPIQKDV